MAQICRAPGPAPVIDWTGGKWQEQEQAYIKGLTALAVRTHPNDPLVGRVVRFQIADGYASYVVWSTRPLMLVWIETGDSYAISEATARGLRLSDIRAMVEYDKRFEAVMDEHDRFYRDLPIGSIVHYDDGFGKFKRCVRVEGGPRERLQPIALVGNWQSYDLPRRGVNGEVIEGYHAEKIRKGERMEPNYKSIWEAMDAEGRAWSMRGVRPPEPQHTANLERRFIAPFDPATAEAIDLSVPEPDEAEKDLARIVRKVEAVRRAVSSDPREQTPEAYQRMLDTVIAVAQ